jgi:hypothetical protein
LTSFVGKVDFEKQSFKIILRECKSIVKILPFLLTDKGVPDMKIPEYCGKEEFSVLQFIIALTDEIQKYLEQIIRFAKIKIDFFFRGFQMKDALLAVYKNEVFNTIMFKINHLLKEYNILQCLS